MSSKDDLTDLMMAGMNQQGVLSKIRAQIKASVYKMMDQQNEKKMSNFFWENQKAQELFKNKQLVLLLETIKEFLQFFDFDYTLQVFSSECNLLEPVKRNDLCDRIGINKNDVDSSKPILVHIYNQFTSGTKVTLKPVAEQTKQKETKEKIEPIKAVDIKLQKKTETTQKIQQKQIPAPINNTKTNKFDSNYNQQKATKKLGDFEEIEEDDMMGESVEELAQTRKPQKENPLFTSSEDFLASQSQGFDITVDSMELEQYDHIEEVQFFKR